MPPRLLAALLAFAPLLAACEGVVSAEGIVSDAATREPLEGVLVGTPDFDGNSTVTDAAGHYRITGALVGCVPHCPDLVVRFSLDGYLTQQLSNPTDVSLEKVSPSASPGP
jgi:hypothetical protein